MQLLTLTVGGQTYALEARNVVEVLPLIPPRPVPLVPDYVLGVITYRGMLVPVIDLGLRLGHRGVETRLSTRLIVVEFVVPRRREQSSDGEASQPHKAHLGLAAENVISTCPSEDADTALPMKELDPVPFFGRLLRLRGAAVHLLVVEHLLPPELLDGLFLAPAVRRSQ